MKGFRTRDVYGLLMLCSKLPSAPISRCQKESESCWTPLLPERLICTQTRFYNFLSPVGYGDVKQVETEHYTWTFAFIRKRQQPWHQVCL